MNTEKIEIAATYIKKMRRLMLWRVLCVGAVTVIFFNMKILSRFGLTEVALRLFGGFALAAAVLALYSQSQLFCPFCGERFKGYVARKLEIIPNECPYCHERLKY